jgi:NAD(P)H-dependent FMN reductase
MRVTTLCGSHHPASTNAIVLGEITARLRAAGAIVDAIDIRTDVDAFRPHLVDDPPPRVRVARQAFESADAVVFSVPEYAGGVPGWIKNITDWMVGSGSLYERPVAVVSSATGGGGHAIVDLARTLTWQGAHVVVTCGIQAPLTKTNNGHVTDPGTIADLDRVASVVLDAIRQDGDRVDELAATALAPLGIDQFDRRT